MTLLDRQQEDKLTQFAAALIDQNRARVIVPPNQPSSGFWFGGGNLIEDADGSLLLVGRYRNHGDSRTGLGAGERGLELALFRSTDRGESFEKVLSFSKPELNVGDREVLSIEGSALRRTKAGFELFVSTEKDDIGYPDGFEEYLKPGTGVWTIERLSASTLDDLKDAVRETVVECRDPRYIHVKDPFLYELPDEQLAVLFCSHPFSWSSSNTGLAIDGAKPVFDFFPRGTTWDVAMTRGTCVLDVPRVGACRDRQVSLMFYDGGESLRNLDEHESAVARPRGYSCEELGGVGYLCDGDLQQFERLSKHLPGFVSPHGTGCSRYVDVLATHDGFYATWQQSQPDYSQPLVMNFVSRSDAESWLQ